LLVGSISRGFKTFGPAAVIGYGQAEQALVTIPLCEKIGMVTEGFFGMAVFSETFIRMVIAAVKSRPGPVIMAFDPEMVVGFFGYFALACRRFYDTLGQGYAGRDMVLIHLLHRDIAVCLDVQTNLQVVGGTLGPGLKSGKAGKEDAGCGIQDAGCGIRALHADAGCRMREKSA